MKYTKDIIMKTADTNEYLFFWGHQPNKTGLIGPSGFSQWWESEFYDQKEKYITAEHWMMAKKSELFNDLEIKKNILESKTPKEAKNWGRKVSHFDPVIWDKRSMKLLKQVIT